MPFEWVYDIERRRWVREWDWGELIALAAVALIVIGEVGSVYAVLRGG